MVCIFCLQKILLLLNRNSPRNLLIFVNTIYVDTNTCKKSNSNIPKVDRSFFELFSRSLFIKVHVNSFKTNIKWRSCSWYKFGKLCSQIYTVWWKIHTVWDWNTEIGANQPNLHRYFWVMWLQLLLLHHKAHILSGGCGFSHKMHICYQIIFVILYCMYTIIHSSCITFYCFLLFIS